MQYRNNFEQYEYLLNIAKDKSHREKTRDQMIK